MKDILYINFNMFYFSLGARLCFATACHMKKTYNIEPLHLFVSGTFPPHVSQYSKYL